MALERELALQPETNTTRARSFRLRSISISFLKRGGKVEARKIIEIEDIVITPQRQKLLKNIKGREGRQRSANNGKGEGMLLMEGPAGTGKTSIVKEYAALNGKNLYTFQCHGNITVDDFSRAVDENGTDSIVVQAIQDPNAILFFDEYNTLSAEVRGALHSLFDQRRELTTGTGQNDVVKVVPGVFFIAAQNPARSRNGIDNLDDSERSRLDTLYVGYPKVTDRDENGEITYIHADEALMAKRNLGLFPDHSPAKFFDIWEKEVNGNGAKNINKDEREQIQSIKELLLIAERLRWMFEDYENGHSEIKVTHQFTLRDTQKSIQRLLDKENPIILTDSDRAKGITYAKEAIILHWIAKFRADYPQESLRLRRAVIEMEV